jgi:hypothetical protein
MDSHQLTTKTPLLRPRRGASTRVQVGSSELVLEAVRGGHTLLWLDGREARRYALGLTADGDLSLELRAPRLPLRIVCREVLTLVPGGRLRGYVQVPLVPTIVWQPAGDAATALIELNPRELAAEWDDHEGAVFRCASSLHVRLPMRSGEARASVPLWLRNDGDTALAPAFLPLRLLDGDLVELRGSLVVRPRRLQWTGTAWRTAAGVAEMEVKS